MPATEKRHVDLELKTPKGKAVSYRLDPNYRALLRIAREVGDPFRAVLRLGRIPELGPPEMLTVFATLRIALAESGHDVKEADALGMFFATGLNALLQPYCEFAGALVNGGVVTGDTLEIALPDAPLPPPARKSRRKAAAG